MDHREILGCIKDVFPRMKLKPDEIAAFFKTIGLMNPGGSLYKEREKKAYETIHFSGHVVRSINNITKKREVALLDCGCGRSYTSFLVNYILKKQGRSLRYIGVDTNAKLVERSVQIRDRLSFDNMQFVQSNIIDFDPERYVNVVCALHACDTATDEAIAKGVKLRARYIIAAPCCQRQIVRQVGRASKKVRSIKPLLEQKVAKEYVGVALTETLRKLALESFGYQVEMFQFISARHTPKNIMLRAEKKRQWNDESLDAYRDLRNYFDVRPKIEKYLVELA